MRVAGAPYNYTLVTSVAGLLDARLRHADPGSINRPDLFQRTVTCLIFGQTELQYYLRMSELLGQIERDIRSQPYFQQNFSNDGERFLAWYLRNVLMRTPIQARDDITDGSDDKQIDALIVDDELRRISILQGKFYNYRSVDGEPLREILAAWMQIQNLPALQENCNQRLKVKLEAVAEALQEDYEVVFELITTGSLTEAAKGDLASFQDSLSEFEHPGASISLVDSETLKARWDEAILRELPKLSHTVTLEKGRYLSLEVANFKTVLAALPLEDCLRFPGIREGTLFRRNVRQSLGLTNKVNKGLKQTLNSDNPQYFFLYHNGITALCEELELDAEKAELHLKGLSVVNGCQSLNTILSCSERIRNSEEARVLFRFYEIPQRDLADKISVYTNSQSAVKPRDLRSNDKRVLALKRSYETMYPDGYLVVKRGEERPADRNAEKTLDIVELAKCLMSWHGQRPNIANNENRLFDKHFELLFRSDYPPADILALHKWASVVQKKWDEGSLGLNEALLAAPSYSKFHLLFALQSCFSIASDQGDKIPFPSATLGPIESPDGVMSMAANCYNSALDIAVNEYTEKGKLFSPQNWLKAKDSILKIQGAVRMYMGLLGSMPGGPDLKASLRVPADQFTLRWAAD